MARLLTSTIRAISNSNTMQPKALPMLNEVSANLRTYFDGQSQITKKRALMRLYKRTGELNAIVNKVARDLTANYHFEPVSGTGASRIKKANRFALQMGYRRIKFTEAVDKLVTGESYKWIGMLTNDQIRSSALKHISNYKGLEKKEKSILVDSFVKHMQELKQTDEIGVMQGFNEEIMEPQKLNYLASSTMENIFDSYGVTKYIQSIDMLRPVEYSLPEIIRSTYMDIDGKASGFTPVESVLVQIELLRFMWQNMLSIQKNGGAPDKMFILKNTDVNSPAYTRIKEQLEKYKLVENKHGNMLFTGEVTIEDLTQLENMQFMDMGLLITGLLAMHWQVPKSSIPYIVGGTNTKDDTGGNSEKGYWDNIECMQRIDAEIDNSQLWIPHFGVKLVYDKTYVQKDVQEETAKQLMINNAITMEQLLKTSKVRLSQDKKIKLLGLTSADVEVIPEDELEGFGEDSVTSMDKQPSKSDNASVGAKNHAQKKREEQSASERSNSPSTGTGKEIQASPEGKEVIKNIDFDNFIIIYNEDKAYHPGKPPRILKNTNEFFTTFTFKSSDFVFQTVIRNDELETRKVSLMNLSGQIYKDVKQ